MHYLLKNCLGRVVEIKNGDKTINLKKRRITDKIVVLLSKSMNRKLNRTLKIKNKRCPIEVWQYSIISFLVKRRRGYV